MIDDGRGVIQAPPDEPRGGPMAKQPMGDVVVLLPGILGSVLTRDGKDVWAPSAGCDRAGAVVARPQRRVARSWHDDPWERDDLGDGVDGAAADVGRAPHPGLLEHRRLRRHLADDHRPLRRRARRDLRRVPLRLAAGQPRRGPQAAAGRRREAARPAPAQPGRQGDPDRPLDGRARRALVPRVPRRLARHAGADHVRHAAPWLARTPSTSSSTGS